MLELSDIKSSEKELQEYYAQLRAEHVTPAWIGGGVSIEPQSKAVPYLWHWRDLRPQAMRAAELVGTQQAERRVLRLTNPELSGVSASNTLVANIQIVMPGEIARAHRHSAAALRLIIEGGGGYTVVNGERVSMFPGDLVLTPNWTWHDHANDTDAPMIWLDGLDPRWCGCSRPGSTRSITRSGKTSVQPSIRRPGTTQCRRCGPPCNGGRTRLPVLPATGSSSNTPTGRPAAR